MKVTLRERNQGGKTSLYLDFYEKGKRKRVNLNLYLNPNPKTTEERDMNKKTLQLAEAIKGQKQIEIQNGTYGFNDAEKKKANFITYLKVLAEQRLENDGNYGNWDSMIKYFEKFAPADISFNEVDKKLVMKFKDFLDKAKMKSNVELSQNSKYSYFNKFRAALKQAVKDEILPTNPAEGIDGFKQGESQREFLTYEELQKVAKIECEIPIMKTAFMFSSLTGLRWSDVNKLTWGEMQHSNELGYYIRFRQKKTKGTETQPISEQAFNLLGERDKDEERVFKGLKYSSWHNLKLQQWVMKAGISRTISFHCARHTYATLQLTLGTDIYTVSKLLGHRELRTTQIYAKVIDSKKVEAANKIKLDL